ncbi:unnamed protein product [Rhizoctonia solani]|uniref:DNA 3'-5' helicase n=1 Tax=Rhizoctonia solani TaxID=456999 RepID=A0A8H3DIR9_9AGAM|nr:unnamed protein product [Rhizoctonia solani]
MTKSSHLQNLNEAQYRAVTSTPAGALQILAGPGSGKTRVLTCRVANMVIDHGISASSICAVTFTNKAAAEMRIRLTRLIGSGETSQLVIGTFHAICANYLRKYGAAIGLATNFSICDSDESKKTISTLLQKHTPELESAGLDLKEPVVRAMISKAKATGQTPQEMLRTASSVSTQDKIQAAVAHIYEEYDVVLREANALDFDDLLVMGLKVLKAAPRAIAKLRHVVVDEFQDTNTVQYELMRVLADACGGYVSVVGDPDQSNVTNLSRMRKDKQRVQKSLFTSHAHGPPPLLREFESAAAEALDLKEPVVRSMISKAKATGQTPREMLRVATSVSTQDKLQAAVAHIYEEYDGVLREANALDFDDLLVMGLKVLKAAPRAIAKLRHVVVDEFQDTNTVQYELMQILADACGGYVSVVGDPDQSSELADTVVLSFLTFDRKVYGWRSADVTNLSRMRKDKQRVQKSLFTSHARGPIPLLREFRSATEEASFLARELRRVIASSGGMIGYGDCAVLLRFSALSRVIEAALQQESVPSRVLGGHKFFERAEVKDVLVYLQLADNPAFTPAFVRAVNVPKRGVGEKVRGIYRCWFVALFNYFAFMNAVLITANRITQSIAEVVARATSEKTSAFNVIERICDGTAPDIKPPIKRKVLELVRLIRQLRKWAAEGVLAADLIRRTVDAIGYEAYLQRTQPDWETRWENVQELVNFAAGVEIPEPEDLIAEDNEAEDLDNLGDTGGYPSDSEEPIAGGTASTSASSSRPTSTKGLPPMGSGKQLGKRSSRPSGSEGRDTITMKQATLSNWRSASRSNSAPPQRQQPKLSLDDDVLDLTGTDDEGTLPQNPTDTDIPTKKLLRPRRDNQHTPLRAFLQASLLSTDSETKEEESKGKVTITTCHAAKGLEWPVVIVPAVEGGTYPFYRAEDIEEERRLLYVA